MHILESVSRSLCRLWVCTVRAKQPHMTTTRGSAIWRTPKNDRCSVQLSKTKEQNSRTSSHAVWCVRVCMSGYKSKELSHTRARRGAMPGRGKAEKGPAVYLWWQWFPAWGKINAGTLKQSKHPALNKVQTIASILFAIKGKLNLGCCLAIFLFSVWTGKVGVGSAVHLRHKRAQKVNHITRLLSFKAAIVAFACRGANALFYLYSLHFELHVILSGGLPIFPFLPAVAVLSVLHLLPVV